MKKVLGIVGSLRKFGNCELMIKEVSRQITVPHELQLLRLPEFNLDYCNGCYRCLMAKQGCVLKDDLSIVLDTIECSDVLILAVPTYFLAAHACLKSFMDRVISFYPRAKKLWGKPAVGIGIAGMEGKEGSTLLDIEKFFASLMAQNKSSKIIYGALPGETLFNQANRSIASELARALFSEMQAKQGLFCSCCGGETFRFYSETRVRCMLCSESGRLITTGGLAEIEMDQNEHQFLASEAGALKHRDFLLGTAERFKEQKDTLAKIRAEYIDEICWVLPEK